MNEERKPFWPWVAILLLGLPLMYVASFGPACWLAGRKVVPVAFVARAYPGVIRMVLMTCCHPNKPFWRIVYGYLRLGSERGARIPLECWHSGEMTP